MFITLTIDTNIKRKKSAIRLHKRKVNPAKGWRRPLHLKKRTLWQKFKDWRKEIKGSQYKLDGQIAMF